MQDVFARARALLSSGHVIITCILFEWCSRAVRNYAPTQEKSHVYDFFYSKPTNEDLLNEYKADIEM